LVPRAASRRSKLTELLEEFPPHLDDRVAIHLVRSSQMRLCGLHKKLHQMPHLSAGGMPLLFLSLLRRHDGPVL